MGHGKDEPEIYERALEYLGTSKENTIVFEDIRPYAVKIGMVPNGELFHVIAERLKAYKAENIVVDPVMVATSGFKLMQYPH